MRDLAYVCVHSMVCGNLQEHIFNVQIVHARIFGIEMISRTLRERERRQARGLEDLMNHPSRAGLSCRINMRGERKRNQTTSLCSNIFEEVLCGEQS
jgi:hypothetical protein